VQVAGCRVQGLEWHAQLLCASGRGYGRFRIKDRVRGLGFSV
jgi:hypothetical protein